MTEVLRAFAFMTRDEAKPSGLSEFDITAVDDRQANSGRVQVRFISALGYSVSIQSGEENGVDLG